jgi:hypothetical protein
MPTEPLRPSVCRENVAHALAEIRACYGDVRTYVAGAFERLDKLVEEAGAQTAREPTARQPEQAAIQEQIDQLARLAAQLTQSAVEHKRMTFNRSEAEREEANT